MSKYQLLHEHGVMLNDDEIDFIIAQILSGVDDACDYFGSTNKIEFISSANFDGIVFVPEAKAINVPMEHFRRVGRAKQMVGALDNATAEIGAGDCKMIIPYPRFLVLAGREEAIHLLQYEGHPQLCAAYPTGYMQMSKVEQVCSAWEIEARHFVDRICEGKGEPPAWAFLDRWLSAAYPDLYQAPVGFRRAGDD